MVKCYYCKKAFKTKKALYAHLQFCAERKKQKDQWLRYRVDGERFRGSIGVISRSPKTLMLIDAAHARLEVGAITAEGFAGYVQALADLKLIEILIEADPSAETPIPSIEGVPA